MLVGTKIYLELFRSIRFISQLSNNAHISQLCNMYANVSSLADIRVRMSINNERPLNQELQT